jgi:hypothetical protein
MTNDQAIAKFRFLDGHNNVQAFALSVATGLIFTDTAMFYYGMNPLTPISQHDITTITSVCHKATQSCLIFQFSNTQEVFQHSPDFWLNMSVMRLIEYLRSGTLADGSSLNRLPIPNIVIVPEVEMSKRDIVIGCIGGFGFFLWFILSLFQMIFPRRRRR